MHAFSLEIIKKTHPGLPAGHYLADRDKKICDQIPKYEESRSYRASGPQATSEIVLRYALLTLTKRTDVNFSRFLIFLINIFFTFLKSELRFLRCNSEFFDQTTQRCDELGVLCWMDG